MYDKASIANSIDGLIRQINLAVATDADSEGGQLQELPPSPDFSTKDLRDELDRLKGEQDTATVNSRQNAPGQAPVPAVAPGLPPGVLVTQSMKELLSHLVTGDKTRVGFLVTARFVLLATLQNVFALTFCAQLISHGVGNGGSWKNSRG